MENQRKTLLLKEAFYECVIKLKNVQILYEQICKTLFPANNSLFLIMNFHEGEQIHEIIRQKYALSNKFNLKSIHVCLV